MLTLIPRHSFNSFEYYYPLASKKKADGEILAEFVVQSGWVCDVSRNAKAKQKIQDLIQNSGCEIDKTYKFPRAIVYRWHRKD